ncbi:MAG: hypothetical protein ACOZBH_03405 [Patescibacteria group bacterium]
MNNWEKKLGGLRQDFNVEVQARVMEKISNVKMTPKIYFQSKKTLMILLFLSLLLAVVFIINLALYDVQQSASYEYINFGASGIGVFLRNLPYLLLFSMLVFLALSIWMMSKFELSYKKYFAVFIVVIVAGTSMGGTALFASGFNDQMRNKVDNQELTMPLVRPVARKLYNTYGPRMIDRSLVGRVAVPPGESREMLVITPQGQQVTVKIQKNCKIVSAQGTVASGDMLIIMGEPVVNFHASGIKVIEDQRRAIDMMKTLSRRQLMVKFRKPEPLNDAIEFPFDPEKKIKFMENMGGVLQSGSQVKTANIIWGD